MPEPDEAWNRDNKKPLKVRAFKGRPANKPAPPGGGDGLKPGECPPGFFPVL